MRRTFALLLTLLLAGAALAGCATPNADDEEDDEVEPTPMTMTPTTVVTPTPTPTMTPSPTPTPALDSSTYSLSTTGVPGQALPGEAFNFTLYANGSVNATSDHIGAHFSNNDTTNPPGAGRGDCAHQSGDLPGTFVVDCTLASEGTWYVWGHARINDSGEIRNWWTAAPSVVKVRNYTLNATGFPTNPPASKQNFTFTLRVNGTDNATTDHLGAHFWNATQSAPTVANSAGACAHTNATGVIGTFTVTCSIENTGLTAKDFFVRGHLRISEGGSTLNWWSDEVKVSVVGLPVSPIP